MTGSAEPDPDGAAQPAQPDGGPGPARAGTRGALLGAMFLMATSAIGPGFITQTATFTAALGAAFAFALLVSVLIDIAVQLNVWRVVGVAGRYVQDLADRVVPRAGLVLVVLVVLGGLAFNIANVGGTGLGLQAVAGLDTRIGAAASAVLAIAVFLVRRAQTAMDRVVVVLGVVMVVLALVAAVAAEPPVGEALVQTVAPDTVSFVVITTLVGGTVGGYITYSGAHRMVDSGVSGPADVRAVARTSVIGIVLTAVVRALLFLVVLGVTAAGVRLGAENTMADAFSASLGGIGRRIFGVVLWAAAVSSVIGAAYTSVSFLSSLHPAVARRRSWVTVGFIAVSTAVFLLVGEPQTLLLLAGAVNGLILPVGFGFLLWIAARRAGDLLGGYRYPRWLLVVGVLAWALAVYFGVRSIGALSSLGA